jgi:kinesin family protein C1
MLEIYNETIRDLLIVSKADSQKTDAIKMLTIKHDSLGNTTISDLTLVQVTNWKEVSALLHQAARCRLETVSFVPHFQFLVICHVPHYY